MSKSRSQQNASLKLRKLAEAEIQQKTGRTHVSEIEHELNVHEIELQMQNAELLDTQEKLNASLVEYAELFELSPVAYFILDKTGLIKNVNLRATVQLGIDKEHLRNKPFSTFLHTQTDQDNFYRHMNRAIEEGTLERMEGEIRKKDGAVFFGFIKSKVIRDERNQFKHLLVIMTDISLLKEHEHQIEMRLIKSEELNDMKSRFIGMASHEFRTPLTSMLASTSLVGKYAESGDREKMRGHLTRIKSSIRTLVTILDEFLSIEKLESGKVEVQHTDFLLCDFCEELIEEVTAATLKKGQSIHYNHEGPAEITGDKKALQHILLNLLSNACKYSPEDKSMSLSTRVTNGSVLFVIKDSGIGIPEAEQDNVFTRFFRARNTGNIQGRGLRLNIVKRYVDLLGGTIDFVSKSHEGTTFTVELPQI